jgi:putative FmdB family regulatory protein
MPTYDYECTKCGRIFEVFQPMSAKPLKSCPKCKGKVNRLIGAGGGLIFKGSGFYATDYKKSPAKPRPSMGGQDKPCEKADSSCPASCKHKHG